MPSTHLSAATDRYLLDTPLVPFGGGTAMEMMCSRDFDGGRDYFVFAQQFDEVDLPDDACHILVIDGVPSVGRIIDQVGAYQQPITCFSSYNFDMQSLGYVDVYVMRRFF